MPDRSAEAGLSRLRRRASPTIPRLAGCGRVLPLQAGRIAGEAVPGAVSEHALEERIHG